MIALYYAKAVGTLAVNIKPIKTEADYEAALEEIDRLMDAEPDTPEGDRLDVLTTLVEAWEQKHYQSTARICRARPKAGSPIRRRVDRCRP
jgi:antitoxin component HigA of HigAB toxin-antitoxin module